MTSAELTIGEVAERTGLTRHTLHYYARDGLMLGVGRGGSGRRRYFEHDLGWIELITKLRRPACRSARSAATPSWSGPAMAAYLDALEIKIGHDTDAIEACESPDSYLNSPRPAADAVPR